MLNLFSTNISLSGEYIESDKFFVSAHGMDLEWQLCLYPSGKDCDDEEHVSILLELVSRFNCLVQEIDIRISIF